MLLYEDGVKVDFKLYSKSKFIKETQEKELPEDWDIGYKILIDKDGITKQMLKPTYQISIIKNRLKRVSKSNKRFLVGHNLRGKVSCER